MHPPDDPTLRRVLERHRTLGSLGPGPVEEHLRQGEALAEVIGSSVELLLDLGSGGGVPALVVGSLVAGPLVLVERRTRRADALELALTELGWRDRASVRTEDVTVTARSELRATADVVLTRSFGPPAVVAEHAAPLLRVGGRLIVTGPPEPPVWPEAGLALVGLGPLVWRSIGGWTIGVATQVAACPDRFPRRGDRARRDLLFRVARP